MSSINFALKVKESKSVVLFTKASNKTATPQEMDLLAINVGFANKEALGAYLKDAYSSKIAMHDKFPELNTVADKNEILSKAISKVIAGNVPLTTAQCWGLWLALMNICNGTCYLAENYDLCWWGCQGAASSEAGLCFLLAD